MERQKNIFKDPDASYRGKPFWSWNGELEKKELLRQIDNFKTMGMGGYFCHSRVGLVTEYLGKDWFGLVNACADRGAEVGMETWLYDEDRWPSGTAGGAVTENPDYRIKYMRLEILSGKDFVWNGEGFACFTARVDGFAFYDKHQMVKGEPSDGRTVLLFTLEEMEKESFYNGYTYVDTMNAAAVQDFIRRTHEQYALECGNRMGKTLYGIFTDEPHRGQLMCGFGVKNRDAEYLAPWTPTLFEDFKKTFGTDLISQLPELFLWKNGEKVSPVKWQYVELLQQKFQNVYMTLNHQWCHEHGMLLTGHLLHEDSLTAQTAMLGSLMRAYEYMDIPGVDVLGADNKVYWIVKQLSSAARQLGKKKLLSEMYAISGWDFRFDNFKALGDWQALFGINQRCHHLSWYTMKGTAKRDLPTSISGQSAWYPYFNKVEDYFSRIHVFMEVGEPICDILVISPIESVWVNIYPGWSNELDAQSLDVKNIEKRYADTFYLLSEAKLDFDYGDEDFLKRFASVGTDEKGVFLQVGKARYRTVLVTGMLTVRSTTLVLLYEFAQRGGQVVFAGKPPEYVDALPSSEAEMLPAKYISWDKTSVLTALHTEPLVTVTDEQGNLVPSVYAQARRVGEDINIFLLNMDWENAYTGCRVKISKGGFCEKWDPRTGDISLLAFGEKPEFYYDFGPDEELLIHVTPKDSGVKKMIPKGTLVATYPIKDKYDFALAEPNVCPLNFVKYRIDGGEWSEKSDIIPADNAIRQSLGLNRRSGEQLQPWFVAKCDDAVLCELELAYTFSIDFMPRCIKLAVESPEDFDIKINGKTALKKTDDFWVDVAFTVFELDISALKKGENTISLFSAFREKINLESLYLLGDFGVVLKDEKAVLNKLPNRLQNGDLNKQGLPFYGAAVSYFVTVPEYKDGQRLFLSAASTDGAACVHVVGDGGSAVLWASPYEADITDIAVSCGQLELQYVFTRKNTFEPFADELHDTPKYKFLTQGMSENLCFTVRKEL